MPDETRDAIEARVMSLGDIAHSTGTDLREYFIRAEFWASRERHM
jgi:hypothetical protein